ncbi:MAG: transporter [Flavobacteriales bacterium]|nr:MAG: transporter [Flavobacteriales bacterium]
MKLKYTAIFFLFGYTVLLAQDKKWTLKECVNYALENNLSVQRSAQVTELRKQDVKTAKGDFLPGLSASANHNYNFGSNFNPVTNSRVSTDSRSNSFNVGANWDLFTGLGNKNSLKRAKTELAASNYDLEKMKNDISLNILNAYLEILFNKENLKVAEAQLLISKEQLERTKNLVDAGVQPKGNLLEVEATLANDESQVISAENNVELSLLKLAQILQISSDNFSIETIDVDIDNINLLYNSSDEVFQKAVASLPEIKSAQLAVESAETQIKIAKSNYYPSLRLSAGMGSVYNHLLRGNDDYYITDPNNPTNQILVKNGFFDQMDNNFGQSFGLSLSIPIFNRGQVKASVNKAAINKKISKINLSDEKLKLREVIEQAYVNATTALKEYEAAEKSVKAQETAFEFARERYNLGATNSFDFEQVRNRLVTAQANWIRAKYNYVFRTKLLEFYYGIPIVE